jgi:hypothetical protein
VLTVEVQLKGLRSDLMKNYGAADDLAAWQNNGCRRIGLK